MLQRLTRKIFHLRDKEQHALLHTTDLHSHLIPNIDDGVKSMQESVEILRQLESLGFKKVITTPHTMSHRFPNTQEIIHAGYKSLQERLQKEDIKITLEVASEYYYDENFLELIAKNELLSFGERHILFELSYNIKPIMLEQTVQQLLNAGYKPILAHPERYNYYSTPEHYLHLKEMGLLFQINAVSMQNFYGKKVKNAVEQIIKMGLVDFIGSDIHSQKYVDAYIQCIQSKAYAKIFENNSIKNDYL